MFVDQVPIVKISAGDGGNGSVHWMRAKYIPKGGPGGGNGGDGGDVFITASISVDSLEWFSDKRHLKAENGTPGQKNCSRGKDGSSLNLFVPCGTKIFDINKQSLICELINNGDSICICRGGRGGKGNMCFSSSSNRTPHFCTDGKKGDVVEVSMEMLTIADIGIVGFPNVGKTSLFSSITGADHQIGNYPFTTLIPNIGVKNYVVGTKISFADIPGLIEGASTGKGLGIDFLRHIFRTHLLFIVLEAEDKEIMLNKASILMNEMDQYDKSLSEKEKVVIVNKIDLLNKESFDEIESSLKSLVESQVFFTSASTGQGIEHLLNYIEHKFNVPG